MRCDGDSGRRGRVVIVEHVARLKNRKALKFKAHKTLSLKAKKVIKLKDGHRHIEESKSERGIKLGYD